MIPRSIIRKALSRRFSQAAKRVPFLWQLEGHRYFSASVQDVKFFSNIHDFSPVHARSRPRPQESSRRKPVSLPLADLPIEIEQLVSVVRRKGNCADLVHSLDALAIRITPYHVVKALNLIDDAKGAIHFFAWAVQQPGFSHNVYTCMSLVTILVRAREFDKIWEFLSEMHMAGCQLTDGCFNITIKAYGDMGNEREALRTFRKMREFGVLPTAYTYNTLISVLRKAQKLDLAVEIYHESLQAAHVKDDMFSPSMIVSALCNAGRLQEACVMATDAAKRGRLTSKFTWNTLINGLCRAGKVEQGMEIFSTMEDMGIETDAVTYSTIIAGLCKLGKLSDAMTYMARMKDNGFEPTDITYTPLLDAICKAGRMEEGLDLLKKISPYGGNAIQFNIFVVAYGRLERMDEACAMYDKMVKNGCRPCASTYGVLIQGLCKEGRFKEALRIFNEMRVGKCEPNAAAYKVMVQGLSKAGYPDEAAKMFEEMLAQGYEANATTCKRLIEGLCQQGSLDAAKKTLVMMLKENCEAKLKAMCTYLKELCYSNQLDAACQCLKEMSDRGLEPNTHAYNILIFGAFKAGDLAKALELCSEMRRKGCDLDIYTYAELFKIAWKARRVDAVLDIYHDMREHHVRANPFVFSIIVKALCKMNKVAEACIICSQIFKDGFVESNESSSNLDKANFIELRVFVPLLSHLQDCGNVNEMVNLWDCILQTGLFSWHDDAQKTLE